MTNNIYNIPNNFNKLNTATSASPLTTPAGQATPNMQQWMQQVDFRLGGLYGGVYAASTSTYILQTPDSNLPNSQALITLTPGFLLNQSNGSIRSTGTITLANSYLTNSSIIINSIRMSLGSSYTLTASPSGAAGGDLTGTYPNPSIIKADIVAATYFGAA